MSGRSHISNSWMKNKIEIKSWALSPNKKKCLFWRVIPRLVVQKSQTVRHQLLGYSEVFFVQFPKYSYFALWRGTTLSATLSECLKNETSCSPNLSISQRSQDFFVLNCWKVDVTFPIPKLHMKSTLNFTFPFRMHSRIQKKM